MSLIRLPSGSLVITIADDESERRARSALSGASPEQIRSHLEGARAWASTLAARLIFAPLTRAGATGFVLTKDEGVEDLLNRMPALYNAPYPRLIDKADVPCSLDGAVREILDWSRLAEAVLDAGSPLSLTTTEKQRIHVTLERALDEVASWVVNAAHRAELPLEAPSLPTVGEVIDLVFLDVPDAEWDDEDDEDGGWDDDPAHEEHVGYGEILAEFGLTIDDVSRG